MLNIWKLYNINESENSGKFFPFFFKREDKNHQQSLVKKNLTRFKQDWN